MLGRLSIVARGQRASTPVLLSKPSATSYARALGNHSIKPHPLDNLMFQVRAAGTLREPTPTTATHLAPSAPVRRSPGTSVTSFVRNFSSVRPNQRVVDWQDSIGALHDLGETTTPGKKSAKVDAYIVTEAGDFETVTLDRREYCSEVKLPQRDFWTVDPSVPYNQPTLLAREETIVFNFIIASGVITDTSVTLMKPEDPVQVERVERIARRLFRNQQLRNSEERAMISDSSPFEFAALESVLVEYCAFLRTNLRNQSLLVDTLVSQLSADIHDFSLIERVAPITNELVEMETNINHARKALHDILNNDEDMAAMYLSHKHDLGESRSTEQHEEIELILEPYLAELDRVYWECRVLKKGIQAAVNTVTLRLDGERNYVMRLSLRINLAMAAMTPGVAVAGLFGMNLVSDLESHPSAFYFATGGILGGSAAMFGMLLAWARSRGL